MASFRGMEIWLDLGSVGMACVLGWGLYVEGASGSHTRESAWFKKGHMIFITYVISIYNVLLLSVV